MKHFKSFWNLLKAFEPFKNFTFVCFWVGTFVCFWGTLGTIGCFWVLLGCFGYFWVLAETGKLKLTIASIDHNLVLLQRYPHKNIYQYVFFSNSSFLIFFLIFISCFMFNKKNEPRAKYQIKCQVVLKTQRTQWKTFSSNVPC